MRLQSTLIVAVLVAVTLLLGSVYMLAQWSFDRGMLEYVNQRQVQRQATLIASLQSHYEQYGQWRYFEQRPRRWLRFLRDSAKQNEPIDAIRPPPPHHRPPPGRWDDVRAPSPKRDRPPGFRRDKALRISLLDADEEVVIGRYQPNDTRLPIDVNNQTVGWLGVPPIRQITDRRDLAFVEKQVEALVMVAGVACVITLMIAVPLARRLAYPLGVLAKATHRLNRGQYDVVLPTSGIQELDQLSRDVSMLAATLESNEQARNQWIADISHELRTPLAIARGEVEAMQDGVRPCSPEHLASVAEEIEQLQRLIEDLHQLTQADLGALRYQKETVVLGPLVVDALQRHQRDLDEKHTRVQVQMPEFPIEVWADPVRLNQVLDNVLHNSVKYADPHGEMHVKLVLNGAQVVMAIEDSGPGVPEAARAHLFERLYRVESSRNRQTGGSGLGLAICQKILHAHEGTITADASELGGLAITLTLPHTKGAK